MRVFRDLEMVEQLGSGVPKILTHYPKSSYIFTTNFVRLVLPFSEGFKNYEDKESDFKQDSAHIDFSDLTLRQKDILSLLSKKSYNISDLSEKFITKYSKRVIQRELIYLENIGFVKRRGVGRWIVWEIVKK